MLVSTCRLCTTGNIVITFGIDVTYCKMCINLHSFDLKMRFWERGVYYTRVINLSKNYQNVIIVSMLLEQRNGWKQSSWVSVRRQLSYYVILTIRDADRPHLTILGIHIAHLAYITPRDHRHLGFVPWTVAAPLAHPWRRVCCVMSRLTLH